MATQVTNYKCPACTGPLHFVGASGKLECDYCGSSFDVAEIEAMYAAAEEKAEAAAEAAQEKEEQAAAQADEWSAGGNWSAEETAGMKVYSCPSCGAEIVCDETTAATACVYCGNPSVVPGQFSGGLKPDYVIPFKLDKNAAIAALKKYYKGKMLLPKAFSANNHIAEIKGVYVPFWLFVGEVQCAANYDADNYHSHREGDYEVTETMHYKVHRAGNFRFERIPADASTKMPDAHMDAVEPFDYSELKPFSTAYLPGFLADKYDVSQEASMARISERAENSIKMGMRNTVRGYSMVTTENENFSFENKEVKYALLPVWMLSTRWNGQNFLFAMNGQTGKLIGDLPVDKGKFWGMFAAIAAPLAIISSLIWILL